VLYISLLLQIMFQFLTLPHTSITPALLYYYALKSDN